MTAIHPLDPLTGDEIIEISSILRINLPEKDLHFKIITILEPPKAKLRPFLRAERNGGVKIPLPRIASSLYYERGTPNLFLAEIDLGTKSIIKVENLDSKLHGQNDIDESESLRKACLSDPKVLAEIKKFKLPEGLELVCDPWPYGRDSEENLPRYVQVKPLSLISNLNIADVERSATSSHGHRTQDQTIMIYLFPSHRSWI
jgi:primary-amine oxidase